MLSQSTKEDRLNKENYRSVSVLSYVSKTFEILMYKQIEEFMNGKLSALLTGYRKNRSTQHCLLKMIENWRKKIDMGKYVGVLFMELSKTFYIIDHNYLIAKLEETYGFSSLSLNYLKSYLDNRQQRVNINNNLSSWDTIFKGVQAPLLARFCLIFFLIIFAPKGFALGPIFFNIFLIDFFLYVTNSHLNNYADDNTPYCHGEIKNEVEEKSKSISN